MKSNRYQKHVQSTPLSNHVRNPAELEKAEKALNDAVRAIYAAGDGSCEWYRMTFIMIQSIAFAMKGCELLAWHHKRGTL